MIHVKVLDFWWVGGACCVTTLPYHLFQDIVCWLRPTLDLLRPTLDFGGHEIRVFGRPFQWLVKKRGQFGRLRLGCG